MTWQITLLSGKIVLSYLVRPTMTRQEVENVSYFVNDVTITLCGLLHMHPFQIDTSMKALHQMAAEIKSLNTKVDTLLGQKVSLSLIVIL